MRYIFAKNINNTGETGIVDLTTFKLLCICDEANSKILLEALKLYSELGKTLESPKEIEVSGSLLSEKSIEYAKFTHGEEYYDDTFARDVITSIQDFKAGFTSGVKWLVNHIKDEE